VLLVSKTFEVLAVAGGAGTLTGGSCTTLPVSGEVFSYIE